MISIENLTKVYIGGETPTKALRGVTLSIREGEFVSIMGPSGSGKSTLLHILSFLDRPTEGVYTFNGQTMDALTDTQLAHIRNREMGFVFQSFNLLSRYTVYENVQIPLLYTPVPPKERAARIEAAVRSVGLEDKLHTEAGRLSGGQKQRVAIARALVTEPKVIFADEPTGNLDSHSGLQIMELIASLNRAGRTVVLVTHETQTAEFAQRIITLRDGYIESDKPSSSHPNLQRLK